MKTSDGTTIIATKAENGVTAGIGYFFHEYNSGKREYNVALGHIDSNNEFQAYSAVNELPLLSENEAIEVATNAAKNYVFSIVAGEI